MENKYLTLRVIDGEVVPKIISGYEIDDGKTKLDLSTNKGYTKNENDVLYLYPGTMIPRFKLRDKFKLTTKVENATAVFIPSNLKAFNIITYQSYMPAVVLTGIDTIYGKESKKSKFIESLLKNYECLIDSHELYNNVNLKGGTQAYFTHFVNSREYKSVCSIDDSLRELLNKKTIPIYNEEELIQYINENAYVIDDERYKEMRAMFNSADDDTIIMGMELLANTDYEKSLVYIILLLKEFGNKFYRKKQVDHVNFKTLLNYIGIPKIKLKRCDRNYQSWRTNENITLNDVIDILKRCSQFNKDNVLSITPLFTHASPSDENKKYFYTNALNINLDAF